MRGGQYSLLNLLQKKEEEKRNTFFEILLNTGYQGILRDKTSYIQNVLQTKHPSGQNVLPNKKSLYNIVPHNLCLILLTPLCCRYPRPCALPWRSPSPPRLPSTSSGVSSTRRRTLISTDRYSRQDRYRRQDRYSSQDRYSRQDR